MGKIIPMLTDRPILTDEMIRAMRPHAGEDPDMIAQHHHTLRYATGQILNQLNGDSVVPDGLLVFHPCSDMRLAMRKVGTNGHYKVRGKSAVIILRNPDGENGEKPVMAIVPDNRRHEDWAQPFLASVAA